MTTAAMVVAMVPLLIAKGAGAASRFDIGVVIAAGMTIGTLFTLFVTPAVYTFLAKDYQKARAREAEQGLPAGAEAGVPVPGDGRHACGGSPPRSSGNSRCLGQGRERNAAARGTFGRGPGLQFGRGGSRFVRGEWRPQGSQASQAEAAQPGGRIVTGLLAPNEPLEEPGRAGSSHVRQASHRQSG